MNVMLIAMLHRAATTIKVVRGVIVTEMQRLGIVELLKLLLLLLFVVFNFVFMLLFLKMIDF